MKDLVDRMQDIVEQANKTGEPWPVDEYVEAIFEIKRLRSELVVMTEAIKKIGGQVRPRPLSEEEQKDLAEIQKEDGNEE